MSGVSNSGVSAAPASGQGDPAPAAPAAGEGVPAPEVPAQGKAPEWDGEFDKERAARLVENLRGEVGRTKEALAAANAELEKFRQAQMSDQEKIAEAAKTAQTQLAEARRELAMLRYQLPENAAKFLNGSTPEEIEAQAKELAETFKPAAPADATPPAPALPPMLPVPGHGGDRPSDGQITEDMLESMSPYEIVKARAEGRLDHLLGRK